MNLYSQATIVRQENFKEFPTKSGWDSISNEELSSFIQLLITNYENSTIKRLLQASENNDVDNQDCGELLIALSDTNKYCSGAWYETSADSLTCTKCNNKKPVKITPKSTVYMVHLNNKCTSVGIQELINNSINEETVEVRCQYCYFNGIGNINPTQAEMDNMSLPENEDRVLNVDHVRSPLKFDILPSTTLIIQVNRLGVNKMKNGEDEEYVAYKIHTEVNVFGNEGVIFFGGVRYSLQAIIYHKGNDPSQGHFWCDSLRPTKVGNSREEQVHRWHTFDDGTVKVHESDYFDKCLKYKNMSQMRFKACSMLMYRRI